MSHGYTRRDRAMKNLWINFWWKTISKPRSFTIATEITNCLDREDPVVAYTRTLTQLQTVQ